MNYSKIKEIKNIKANPAVTIYLNTHRTFPDNSKDNIKLKNSIAEVEKRLLNEYSKVETNKIIKKLRDLAEDIDPNYNLDSLIIFVSQNFAEFFRLPIKVKDNVILNNKFATKVLIRSMLQTEDYYILCISRKIIRLIDAINDSVVAEITDGTFPIRNESYIDSDDIRKSWGNIYDNHAKEFFNKADKQFNNYYNRNPKPVVLAGDARNISYYKEIADNKNIIIGYIEGNFDNTKNHEIVKQAYNVIIKFVKDEQEKAIEELALAQKEQKLMVDLNDIYRTVKEGNGLKLYVEKNYFQPAIIENDVITLKNNPAESGVIDDIVNEIIDLVIQFGGSVMFLQIDQLKEYNKIALVTRY